MAGAPTTPVQQLLQARISELSVEMEALFRQTRERGRRDFADQLNQAVRRMRQASTDEELLATLADAAASFAHGAALLRIDGNVAKGERIRGTPEERAEKFRSVEIPLESAKALAGAVESRDPVTTLTSVGEVSQELVQFAGHATDGRAQIFPLVVKERVPALLYVWGDVQGSPVELLTQVAGAVWSGFERPTPAAPELVQIAAPPARPATTWETLPAGEQQIHLRAQRFARVRVAEMRLFEADAVQAARSRRGLYDGLRKSIDEAREKFRRSFFEPCPSMVDYLHLELVRTLANDDPELLGTDYPGPMV